jgi:hypothetical protein
LRITGQVGPAVTRPETPRTTPGLPPLPVPPSEGTADPDSPTNATSPVRATSYVQRCSSMQPDGQSPQPIRTTTRQPSAIGVTWYQAAWPIRFGSYGRIPRN